MEASSRSRRKWRKALTTAEILSQLELMDACDVPGTSADVFITPPGDEGVNSDADSGDEDTCCNPDKLTGSQLRDEAKVVVHDDGTASLQFDSDSSTSSETIPPAKKKMFQKQKKLVRSWKKGNLLPDPVPRAQQQVKSTSAAPLKENFTPLDFWEIFSTKDVIDLIVHFSNLYALQKNETNLKVTPDEIYCVLATLYLSGYLPVARRRMYWEIARDTHNELISASIRRNRFEEIFSFFHVCDNNNLPKNDKTAKIREFMNVLNKSFVENAPNEQNLSVVESMTPYFGRHGCRQFIKGKSIRFGFKAWTLAQKQGYCMQVDIYQRANVTENRPPGVGLGESVVLTFCDVSTFPNVCFSFFCDNFFTCPKLLSELKKRGMRCTGTVRSNRMEGCPVPDKKSTNKKDRGYYESFVDKNENLVAVTWKDNNMVNILSNEFGVEPIQEAKRYSSAQKKTCQNTSTLPSFTIQPKHGGRRQQLDNNVSTYRINIRSKKWYMPIVLWLLDVVMNNAWLLARHHGMKLDAVAFRRFIVTSLLEKYGSPARNVLTRAPVTDAMRESHGGHLLIGDQTWRRCRVCKSKTVTACQKCQVALHAECFSRFHEK